MDIQDQLNKLQNEPDNLELICEIGKNYKQKNDFTKAKEFFELALNKDPDFCPATCSLVHLLIDYGYYTQGVNIVREALLNHKHNETYRATIINALFALFLLHSIALETKQPGNINHNYEELFFKIGSIYKEEELYDAAAKVYESAYTISSINLRLVIDLGDCYINLNQNNKAEKILLNALSIHPNDEDLLIMISKVYCYNEIYYKCIEYSEKLLSIQPNNIDIQNILAYSYIKNNEYNEAIKIYQKQIETTPEAFKPYKNLFIAYRISKKEDKLKELIEYLENNKPKFAGLLQEEISKQIIKLELDV